MTNTIKNQFYPDTVYSPGWMLAEALEDRGISQTDYAERIGCSKAKVKALIQGKSPITPEMASQFEKTLDIPADLWLNMEKAYRDFLANKEQIAGRSDRQVKEAAHG